MQFVLFVFPLVFAAFLCFLYFLLAHGVMGVRLLCGVICCADVFCATHNQTLTTMESEQEVIVNRCEEVKTKMAETEAKAAEYEAALQTSAAGHQHLLDLNISYNNHVRPFGGAPLSSSTPSTTTLLSCFRLMSSCSSLTTWRMK